GSGGASVTKAFGSSGCGLGSSTRVCGMESGVGGAAGAVLATSLGATGAALAVLAALPRRTQPASANAMQAARIAGIRLMMVPGQMQGSYRNRQADQEGCAFPRFAREFDCTIVQLNDPESHGQTDSGALLLGTEIKSKNLFCQFDWNAGAGIGYADLGGIVVGAGFEA